LFKRRFWQGTISRFRIVSLMQTEVRVPRQAGRKGHMSHYRLTEEDRKKWEEDGYILVPNLLDEEEVDILYRAAKGDEGLRNAAMDRRDAAGRASRLSLWNHPSDDVFGMVARSERIVSTMDQLFDGEMYHWHTKLMMKEPKVGGAWEWHQDYGYWYNHGCLYPDMASCLMALDPATKENGCLQVLKGSHKLGRVEHGQFGDQTGADPKRVEAARERLELVHCEMAPGTGLFFHGNVLHASSANDSERPRWSLICCYNAAWNDPIIEKPPHPHYTPLEKASDDAIKAAANTSAAERAYMKAPAE
jgi:ectoine hydroxylase-related dioxygenase (phytanoyl-CoA dioxygenase family)